MYLIHTLTKVAKNEAMAKALDKKLDESKAAPAPLLSMPVPPFHSMPVAPFHSMPVAPFISIPVISFYSMPVLLIYCFLTDDSLLLKTFSRFLSLTKGTANVTLTLTNPINRIRCQI